MKAYHKDQEVNDEVKIACDGRGYARCPAISTAYGAFVEIYESSVDPLGHIWMACKQGRDGLRPELGVVHVHLSPDQARQIIASLQALLDLRADESPGAPLSGHYPPEDQPWPNGPSREWALSEEALSAAQEACAKGRMR